MLKGLVPVLLTPMLKNHEIDHDSLNKLINYLKHYKVGGLWALGSASEEINIGFNKKIEVAKSINKFNKNIKIIIGTGCVSIDDHYRFIDQIDHCDFHGIHVLPYDLKMGMSRVINLFTKVAEKSPWPVWMYHNPKRGRPFEIETIKILSQHKNIRGIKVGGYDLTMLTKCFNLKNKSFDVIGSGSGQLYSCLCLGAEAHTTSEGCVYPKLFQNIIKYFNRGQVKKSLILQNKWNAINLKVPRNSNGEHCAEEKYFLSKLNICKKYVNANYEHSTKSEIKILNKIHKDIIKLCEY